MNSGDKPLARPVHNIIDVGVFGAPQDDKPLVLPMMGGWNVVFTGDEKAAPASAEVSAATPETAKMAADVAACQALEKRTDGFKNCSADDLLCPLSDGGLSSVAVLAQTGRIAAVVTAERWQGKPAEFQKIVNALPADVIDKQLGGQARVDRLLSEVKRGCLAGTRRFAVTPRP